jgi:hypothetical protein
MQKVLRHVYNFIIALTILIAGVAAIAASQESFRNYVWTEYFSKKRKVLAYQTLFPKNSNLRLDILKVAGFKELFIEIHITKTDGTNFRESKRTILPHANDVFFHVGGQAFNLALVDINGDENQEIVTSAQDDELRSEIYIFKFNSVTHELEKI